MNNLFPENFGFFGGQTMKYVVEDADSVDPPPKFTDQMVDPPRITQKIVLPP